MKKRTSERRHAQGTRGPAPAAGSGWNPLIIWGIVALAVAFGAALAWYRADSGRRAETRSSIEGPLTFHRDIAPIIFQHCSTCHHPGEAAPFHLLTYSDVAKRAEQIAEVTRRRIMPP